MPHFGYIWLMTPFVLIGLALLVGLVIVNVDFHVERRAMTPEERAAFDEDMFFS